MATPISEVIDLTQYVENRLMSGRPHVKGRRIPVAFIAKNAQTLTIAAIAEEFDLAVEEVLAALFYYQQHQPELDAQEAEDNRLFDEMAQKQPAKFRKL